MCVEQYGYHSGFWARWMNQRPESGLWKRTWKTLVANLADRDRHSLHHEQLDPCLGLNKRKNSKYPFYDLFTAPHNTKVV